MVGCDRVLGLGWHDVTTDSLLKLGGDEMTMRRDPPWLHSPRLRIDRKLKHTILSRSTLEPRHLGPLRFMPIYRIEGG
jgi:hypothetical protein